MECAKNIFYVPLRITLLYFDILLNYFQFKMHINAEDFGVDMPHVTNYWFKPLHGVD